mmetsp:Transcript_15018/g.32267  ORF Transcript_15018/g.32267 Transcript_15018/m.32267 type:complete len:268 (-) Transcript_15018:25-828(-)
MTYDNADASSNLTITVLVWRNTQMAQSLARRAKYSTAPSNTVADRRRKMSAFDIFEMTTSKWPLVTRAIPTWRRLEKLLFSKDIEVYVAGLEHSFLGVFTHAASKLLPDRIILCGMGGNCFQHVLWKRFNLTRVARYRDFRVQIDTVGYSIGVHTDSPKKILTLMFYVPVDGQTVYDYGTCIHTSEQYQARDVKKNAAAPCLKKFLFASNTGYAFVVNNHSYHSVETVVSKHHSLWSKKGLRRTIIANWYDQPVSEQSFVKQQVIID